MFNLKAKIAADAKRKADAAAAAAAGGSGPVPLQRSQSMRTRMVMRDLQKLDLPPTVKLVHPNPQIVREFYIILSPESGIWGGGRFKFSFTFPERYPELPPHVICETKLWHPNIDREGHVCLNILRDMEWTAVMDVQSVIFGLLLLFYEPNVSDPLNHDAAREMIDSIDRFKEKVRRTFQGGSIDGMVFLRQPIHYT